MAWMRGAFRNYSRWGGNLPGMEDFKTPKLLSAAQTENGRLPSVTVESMNVASAMKRARADPLKIKFIVQTQASRLLRNDMLALFFIFVKAKEFQFAEMVFDVIRKQSCYRPNSKLYLHIINGYCTAGGGFKEKDRVLKLLEEAEGEHFIPNVHMYIIPIKHCTRQGDFDACIRFYEKMHMSVCSKNIDFYLCLRKRLLEAGLLDEAQRVYNDYLELVNTQMLLRKPVEDDDDL